jgi:hypothetical protein
MRFAFRREARKAMTGRGNLKVILGFIASIAIASATIARAQDDWEAVGHQTTEEPSASTQQPGSAEQATAPVAGSQSKTFYACGEKGAAASNDMQSMVARIDALWNTDVRIYQSVEPETPHASAGGCIFYNKPFLRALLTNRLDLEDPNAVGPMLWAIFAHEVGHEMHHDFDPSRASVSSEVKELEADRFAGYTLEKLDIPATNITPYYSLAGDEFGGQVKHGSSEQRVAAFKEGWHLAEWNRPEGSQSALSATDEPVAPDSHEGAPE